MNGCAAPDRASRQRAQRMTQVVGAAPRDLFLDLSMRMLPQREGLAEQCASGRGEGETAAAAVLLVDRDLQEAAPLEWLEIRRERGAVHGKQGGHVSDARRLGTVQRHQQRELATGEIE